MSEKHSGGSGSHQGRPATFCMARYCCMCVWGVGVWELSPNLLVIRGRGA